MAGLLPKWVEDYFVHPFAYGGDQAAGDLVGERGILGFVPDALGMSRWHTSVDKPKGFVPQMISEIPRTVIDSGGTILSPRMLTSVLGGAASGYVRDPGEGLTDSEMGTERNRQAIIGGTGSMVGNLLGNLGVRAIEKAYLNFMAPGAKRAAQEYGATGGKFAGAKDWHSRPQEFEQQLEHMPTADGTFRRGVRPDHPMELAQIQDLKPGDIYEPGKALSADSFGPNSGHSAWGYVNEADEVIRSGAPKRGPYIYIKTKNARDLKNAVGWDEVVTLPSSKFKVTKVVRDRDGNVSELYLEDLSKPSLGRQAGDVVKETGREAVSTLPRGALETAKVKKLKRKANATEAIKGR